MRILACANLNGEFERMRTLAEAVGSEKPDLIAFVGNIANRSRSRAETFGKFFEALDRLSVKSYCIPGEHDAPERTYYAASVGQSRVSTFVEAVHGSFAPAPAREYVIAGFGGRISTTERQTENALIYPCWEVEYRMDFLRHAERRPILLFHQTPAEVKDLDSNREGQHLGHPAVTEMIGTWRPPLAIVAGEYPGHEIYGQTIVVSPGRLQNGEYALVDSVNKTVTLGQL